MSPERSPLKDNLERRIRQSEVLAALSQEIFLASCVDEALRITVKQLSKIFPAYVSVNLLEEDGRYLTVKEHNVESRLLVYAEKLIKRRFSKWKIPLHEDTVISRTIRTGYPTVANLAFKPQEPVFETDILGMLEALVESANPMRRFARPIADKIGPVSLLGIPFFNSSGEVTGSITLVSPQQFNLDDFNLAKVTASIVGRAVQQQLLSANLRDSEERYRSLQENLPLGVFRTTVGGNLLSANSSMLRMLGYSSLEEFKPIPIADVYLDLTRREEFVKLLSKEGVVSNFELEIKRKDGSTFLASLSARAVLGGRGEVTYYDGVFEDITARKREESLRSIKNHLQDKLRVSKTIEDALRLGCEAVRDSGLFKRAVFTTKNKHGETTHFAHVGVDDEIVERLSKAPSASEKMFMQMFRKEFRLSRSYFIPREAGVDFVSTGRYILQEASSGEGPGAWLQGDEFLIPMLGMDGSIDSWLSVDTPFDGKRPDEATALYLEEIADLVARQIRDIESVEALRASEERFRRFTGVVTDMIYRFDTERKEYDFISPSCEVMTGYSIECFKADPENFWRTLIHPDDLERVSLERSQQLVQRSPDNSFNLDYRIVRKDGTVICVNEHGNYELDRDGEITSFNGVVRDITRRKKAEQALRESEERYRVFTEQALIGIYIFSTESRFLYVNPAMERIFGYTREQLLARSPWDHVLSEDMEGIIKERGRAQAAGEVVPANYEMRIVRKDGEVRTLEIQAHEITYEGQKAFLGNCIDVTERKRIEKEVERRAENLRVINELAIDLASGGTDEDIFALIGDKLRTITGALGTAVTLFDSETSQLFIKYLPGRRKDISRIEEALKRKLMEIRIPLEPSLVGSIKASEVVRFKDISDLTFGTIPVSASKAIKNMFGIGDILALVLHHGGELLGAAAIFMPYGSFSIHDDVLKIFANVTSSALRRKQAEDKEQESISNLRFLAQTAMEFVEQKAEVDIYTYIAEKLKELMGDGIVILTSYEERTREFTGRAIAGLREKIGSVLKILGRDSVDVSASVSEFAMSRLMSGKLVEFPEGLFQITAGKIPKEISEALEKVIDLGSKYSMGFVRHGRLLGAAIIVFRKGDHLRNPELVEAFINQASVSLQRRQAEEALRESEELQRALFDWNTDPILIAGLDDSTIMVNPAFERLFGYQAAEIEGRSFPGQEGIDKGKFEEWIEACRRGEGISGYETVRRSKNGQLIPVSITVSPIMTARGNLVSLSFWYRDITERHRAEESLRESEERYRAFTEEALVGIYIYSNSTRRYLYVNPEMARITGYSREELLQIDPNQLPVPDDANIIKEREEAVLKGEQVEPEYSIRICRKDFSVAVLSVRTHRIPFEGEDVALGNCIDMTKRIEAEEERDKNRREIQALFEGVDVLLWSMSEREDGELYYESVNSAFAEVEGYTPEHYNGMPISKVHPPDECKRIRNSYEWAQLGEAHTNEVFFNDRHFIIRIIPLLDQDGKVRRFIGAGLDITDRKRAEEALVKEKERIQRYLDIAGVMLMVLDSEGNVVLMNKKGAEILGIAEEEIIGKNWFENFIPSETSGYLKDVFSELMSAGKESETSFESPVLTGKGERRLILWHNTLLSDDAGKITGLLSSGEDVTERRLAEEEIKRRNEELSALYETSVAVASSLDEQKITNLIAERACEIIKADGYIIYSFDEKTKKLEPQLTTLEKYREQIMAFAVPLGDGITGQCALQRRPIRANNAHLHAEAKHVPGTPEDPTCIMAAPLVSRGELLGAITLTRLSEYGFDEHDFGLFTLFASQAADAAANSRLFSRLRESEERYRAFTEEAMVGVYIYRDGRFLFVNRAMEEITGYSRDELLSRPAFRITYPEDIPVLNAREEARKSGEDVPAQYTMRVIRRDGKIRTLEVRTRPVFYGEAVAYLGNCVDVTEIREIQDALRESEERYRILTEEALVGIYLIIDSKFRFVNPAMEKITGYTRKELLEIDNIYNIIHPDDIKMLEGRVGRRKPGEPDQYTMRTIRKDGEIAVLEVRVRNIPYGEGTASLGNCVDITDMRKMQEALERSEERYRILTEEAMMGIYVSQKRRFIFVNPAMERITGYTREELLKIDTGQVILGEDPEVTRMLEKTRKLKELELHPVRILRKNGDLGYLEIRTRPLMGEGIETVYLANCVDVTEIIRQRVQIEKAKLEWERTFDSISELVMIFDLAGNIIRANRAVAVYNESDIKEIPGKCFADIFHIEKSEAKLISSKVKSRTPEQFEINDPLTKKVFSVTVAPVVSDPGEILGSVYVAHDITEMRRMEQALAKSEAQFRGLAESAQDIIFSLDLDGHVRYVNPALSEIVGFDPSEAIGKDLQSVVGDVVTPQENQEAAIEGLLEGDKIDKVPLFETEIKDYLGRHRILEISSRRLEDGIVGIARDVTERKRMQQQLIQASKLASIGVLAAGIAHQVNNPLAIMLASSSLLRSLLSKRQDIPSEMQEEITDYLDTMEEQVERTSRVVSGLLEFTKPKCFEVRPTDVNAVITESTAWLSQHLSLDRLSVKMELRQDIPKALVDSVALQQVIINVIQNAYEAMEGEGKLQVETGLKDRYVIRIAISDTGPGVPPDMREEIFEPLFTTKSASKGTGLGLAICVMLLERFEGRIILEESSSQGSTFVIQVPVARDSGDESS